MHPFGPFGAFQLRRSGRNDGIAGAPSSSSSNNPPERGVWPVGSRDGSGGTIGSVGLEIVLPLPVGPGGVDDC